MEKVYFAKAKYYETDSINSALKKILKLLDKRLNMKGEVPIKVHFGEHGNDTFIGAENYNGIIDFLKKKKISSRFIETNVLYKGKRTEAKEHKDLAKSHGFGQLPVTIATGYYPVEVNLKHFKSCKIAKEFSEYGNFIVTSHFKGHYLTGFGGAIKQLGMGFASRAGKLDMHASSKPFLNPIKCRKCGACVNKCKEDAIKINKIIPRITKKCSGCAGCIAVCPHGAMIPNWAFGLGKGFHEKLAEYAYAAQMNKRNIYINYVMNITRGCDCVGKKMKTIAPDIGLIASLDPVAADKASIDILKKHKGFRGKYILDYSEKIGLGKKNYEFIKL